MQNLELRIRKESSRLRRQREGFAVSTARRDQLPCASLGRAACWASRVLLFFCSLFLILYSGAVAAEDVGSEDALRRTIGYLSSIKSRVTGYPGCDEAAAYVEMRFRELGLSDIVSEEFKLSRVI